MTCASSSIELHTETSLAIVRQSHQKTTGGWCWPEARSTVPQGFGRRNYKAQIEAVSSSCKFT